jgi:OTT_1508-like deaminase
MPSSLWDLPGLDHVTFTAAANYLHLADEQQYMVGHASHFFASEANQTTPDHDAEWNRDGYGEGPWGYNESDDVDKVTRTSDGQQRRPGMAEGLSDKRITEKFLDLLAQVFSYEKYLDRQKVKVLGKIYHPARNLKARQRPTAAHVSATALVKRHPEKLINIYVAKNKGLDDSDKDFAKSLLAWLQFEGQTVKKPRSDETWERIIDLSTARIDFYIAGILQKERQWYPYKNNLLETVRVRNKGKVEIIERVISQIGELFRQCRYYTQASRSSQSTIKVEVLQLADQIRSDQNFNKLSFYFKEMQRDVEQYFSKLALDINFLGRLPAAWRIFREYASRHAGYKFIPQFIEPPKFKKISTETLLERIKSYPQNMSKKEDALKRLKQGDPAEFAVHCEMQLLLHFDASPNDEVQFRYFGCSKLSCWMCNEMLEAYSGYRTKRTHGRRVGLWAFDSTNQSPRIIFALKRLQDKLTNTLIEEALRMNQTDRFNSMNVVQGSQETDQRARTLNTVKHMLDKLERVLEKPELGPCMMSTPDASVSIGENLGESYGGNRTTERLAFDPWLAEQRKISEQGEAAEEILGMRLPQKGGKIEWLKIKIIRKEGDRPGSDNLPYIWRRKPTEKYIPNISRFSKDVCLNDWVYFQRSSTNHLLPGIIVIFTKKEGVEPNLYIKELVPKSASVGLNEMVIPHGNVFIINEMQDNGFCDIPRVENTIWEAELQRWLQEDMFGKGLERIKERQVMFDQLRSELELLVAGVRNEYGNLQKS